MENIPVDAQQDPSDRRALRLFAVLYGVALILWELAFLLAPWKELTLDYWIWLGCPTPIQMIDWDGYPGNGLTERLRHADYYKRIPHCGMSYARMVRRFGEPEYTKAYDNPYDASCVWVEAAYPGFTVHLSGEKSEPVDERAVVYTVVTTPDISFTHTRFRVGDSRASVQYATRYYDTIIRETELEPGFTWGYIDGSGLTMWTWVEFQFDEADHVKAILLYNPW